MRTAVAGTVAEDGDSGGMPVDASTQRTAEAAPIAYSAFISYAHADRLPWGERWGGWLHRKLEGFALPGPEPHAQPEPLRKRLGPVFLDRAELAADGDLDEALKARLSASRSLVVICSPRSARSDPVGREIAYFKSLGRARQVYALIVGGEPNAGDLAQAGHGRECFHAALRFEVDASGRLGGRAMQPVAADARRIGDGRAMALVRLVAAISDTPFDQLWQREERKRRAARATAAALTAAVVVTLASLAAYAWWQRGLAEQREQVAQARLLAVRAPLLQQRQRADMDATRMLLEAWRIDRASGGHVADEIDQGLRQVLSQPGFGGFVDLPQGLEPLSSLFDATGRWLASTGTDGINRLHRAGSDGWQTVWRGRPDGPTIRLIAGTDPVVLAIDGDGKATLGRIGPRGGALSWGLPWPWPADFEPQLLDGEGAQVLARRASDGCVRWEVQPGSGPPGSTACRWRLPGEHVAAAQTADGHSMVIGSSEAGRILLLRKTRSAWVGQLVRVDFGDQRLQSVALDEPGHGLAIGTHGGQIWWLDLRKRSGVQVLGRTEGGSVNALRIIERGRQIVAGNQEGEVTLWRRADRTQRPVVLRAHTWNVADLAFDRELGVLWSADGQGRLRRWRLSDLAAEPWLPDLQAHQDLLHPPKIHALSFEPGTGHRLMFGGDHGLLQVWNADARDAAPRVFGLGGPAEHVMAGAFSADGQLLSAASVYGEWAVWSADDPKSRLATARLPKGAIPWSMAPDGESGWWLGDSTGRLTHRPGVESAATSNRVHGGLVRTVVTAASGRMVVSSGDDGAVRLLRGPGGGAGEAKWEPIELEATDRAGGGVAVSRDGQRLAIGLSSGVVVVGTDATRRSTLRPAEGGFEAWALAWSPDGRWLAAGGADGTIRLWAVDRLHHSPRLLPGHGAAVRVLSFSSDSRLLASGGFDNTVRVMAVSTEDLIGRACERVREAARAGVPSGDLSSPC